MCCVAAVPRDITAVCLALQPGEESGEEGGRKGKKGRRGGGGGDGDEDMAEVRESYPVVARGTPEV